MRVLLTGVGGYVGAHAALALAEAGADVHGIDDLSAGEEAVARRWPFTRADVRDAAALDGVFARFKPDAVMHFAARALVDESVREPLTYWDVNCAGVVRLVEAMKAHGVGRLVFSSTCAVYGTPEHVPITEDAPKNPQTPYGASKWAAERVIADAAGAGGPRAYMLRYFNAAGADPQGRIGFRAGDPHLIPRAVRAALEGTPMRLFGDDWATRDGTCERDYIHVCDLARAHMLALEALADAPVGFADALNLGTGRGMTNREVIAAAEQATGRAIAVERAPRRDGDPPALVADASRAKAALGFEPARSSIDAMCADAAAWARKA